jgi:hypothetical protein
MQRISARSSPISSLELLLLFPTIVRLTTIQNTTAQLHNRVVADINYVMGGSLCLPHLFFVSLGIKIIIIYPVELVVPPLSLSLVLRDYVSWGYGV